MKEKGSFIVLIVIIAFLSLSIAALAGYVFLGNDKGEGNVANTQQKSVKPSEEELAYLPILEKGYFNLKSEKGTSIIQVSAKIKYFKTIKDVKKPEELVLQAVPEMKEIIGNYFMNMTLEKVREIETKEKAKKELKIKINNIFGEGKDAKEVVYEVIFDEWFYQ